MNEKNTNESIDNAPETAPKDPRPANLAVARERLTKLAEHLETGKMGHKSFDYQSFNSNGASAPDGNRCGTYGCALGEAPIVWPGYWEFDGPSVCLIGQAYENRFGCFGASIFFGIEIAAAEHLFLPHYQNNETFGGERLGPSATKEQVAANIREFVAQENGWSVFA